VEITTIVLEGELNHKDNMGNRGVLGKEDVQCITTGTGIEHLEFNRGKEPLRLYQIWISPYRSHLEPAYSKKKFEVSGWKNRLLPLASGQDFEDALKINANATIYRTSLERGRKLHFDSKECRFVFIYISAGELSVNGQNLRQGDQARLDQEESLHLDTASSAEFLLIDIPANREKFVK
jgi:redox-sensitive bicupin YhaK (pirin superfamily)